tara:strand:- start:1057 stop:1599 length:543 start_codon:yes stop_codon:yes gene_type:complete
MPNPQDVLNQIENNNLDNNLSIDNRSKNSNELTPQIKNISQELEKPKSNFDEKKITSHINSFHDLVNLVEKNKELQLKYDLERNVRLVNFSNGKIDIEFNEKLSKDFVKNLSSKLLDWTNYRWIITLSKEKGDSTIYEKKIGSKNKLFESVKKTNVYKKINEIYPDAELIDVKNLDGGEE